MNLTQNRRLLLILLAVSAFIVLAVISLTIFSFTKRVSPPKVEEDQPQSQQETIAPNKIEPPKIKPEQLPQTTKDIRQKIIASQIADNNGDILLKSTGSYKIEYIPTPDVFFVTITKDPAQNAKQETRQWFLAFGLSQNDLCDLPVRFVLANRELRLSNPNFNSLPDGCTSN